MFATTSVNAGRKKSNFLVATETREIQTPNPAKLVLTSFFLAILAGTGLLMLPLSTVSGKISFVDALFTATSATCVTGLVVVDTGSYFTRFGQNVVLFLIEAGGLGIMTFSTFFLLLLGKRVSVTDRLALRMMGEKFASANLFRALLLIFAMTALIEAAGAALLFVRFRQVFPVGEAIYYSIFHAISAFCNAGFSLFRDSLVGFQREFFLPGVVMILIVFGGLGFFVFADVLEKTGTLIQRRPFRISLHTKLTLITTVALILIGAGLIWILELKNLLSGLPLPLQFWNALFQSITPRTAGFNTLEMASLSNATLYFLTMLMFIGGAPASTAGGIKVTTFSILLALIFAQARGRESTSIFQRKIPQEMIARSLAIFAGSFVLVTLVTFLLQITEHLGVPHGIVRGRFLDLLFETVSAFGTVGLSTGLTPSLTAGGKLLIIFTMFAGRVGPLTLALAIVLKHRREIHYDYPEEEVMVG